MWKNGSRQDTQRCFDSQIKSSKFTSKTRLKFCLTRNKNESLTQTNTNKEGKWATYPLTEALETKNEEMSKWMQYTKNILNHLLQGGTAPIN